MTPRSATPERHHREIKRANGSPFRCLCRFDSIFDVGALSTPDDEPPKSTRTPGVVPGIVEDGGHEGISSAVAR